MMMMWHIKEVATWFLGLMDLKEPLPRPLQLFDLSQLFKSFLFLFLNANLWWMCEEMVSVDVKGVLILFSF